MAKEVVWSERAADDRDEILRYWIHRNKSKTYSDKLNKFFNDEVDSIKKHPEVFIRTDLKNLRARIVRYYLILYEEKSDTVEILAVWDGRRNPKSLKKHLRKEK